MEKTLLQLFEQGESQIREELSTICLPRDNEKLTTFINSFFTDKVQIEDYKKELTISETTMVNSAIRLISLPLSIITTDHIIKEVIPANTINETNDKEGKSEKATQSSASRVISVVKHYTKPVDWALLGTSTLFGGALGGLIYKTWGGVLCTAAGCVLGMYSLFGIHYLMSTVSSKEKTATNIAPISKALDVDVFISLLKQVCAGIDDIIENYRANIKQLTEHQANEKTSNTLADSYKPLLDRMAKMYVAMKSQELSEEVKSEIDKLYRTLKNQHYEIVDYSEETRKYYVETVSPHVKSTTLIKAAILENGQLLEKGECLIPEE